MERSRAFCITLNNYTEEEHISLSDILSQFKYSIIGKEVGKKCGTPHLQGYFELFHAKTRRSVIKSLGNKRIHVEIRRGSVSEAVVYCKKDKDFKEQGTLSNQGARTDILDVKDRIKDGSTIREVVETATSLQSIRVAEKLMTYLEPPRTWKPIVKWYHGPTGTGKTREAFEELTDPYVVNETNKWWDGYDAHPNVIFDDIRPDFCKFHVMLRLFDRYSMRVEYKGGMRQFLARNIIVTCPYHPRDFYKNREDIEQLIRRIDEIKYFPDVYASQDNPPLSPSTPTNSPTYLQEEIVLPLTV